MCRRSKKWSILGQVTYIPNDEIVELALQKTGSVLHSQCLDLTMCRSWDETSGCDNRELHMIWGTVSRNSCFWSCEDVCCWSTVCWRGFWLCQCLGSFCDMEHTLSDLLMPRRCWNFGCLLIQWWRSIGQLKDVNILVGQKDISQVLDLPFPRWIQFERFSA